MTPSLEPLLIAALALIFFVLRPLITGLLRGVRAGDPVPAIESATPPAIGGPNAAAPPGLLAAIGAHDSEIESARLQGEARAASVKRVAELVQQHPDESAEIIRGWLNNAA